jgi:hypothetical protein
MTKDLGSKNRRALGLASAALFLAIAALSTSPGRILAGRFLSSLRMQNVQAVNINFSPFVDASANPTLHQMVTQMISDKVQVELNENDQPVSDAAAASQMAGFRVLLLGLRKDSPKLVVGGAHKVDMSVDRARLQVIAAEAGHPELTLPQSLDGADLGVQIPRSVHAQYGICPGPTNAASAISSNITGPTPTTTQYSDCVRLRQGPAAEVKVPPGLDVANLAEIGLETAGMTSTQARDFLQTVDWKTMLTLNVPRFLRSYEEVKVDGARGTLLSMAGRRGPGYALIWAKDGIAYSLTGFGDSSQAVVLADSLR